MSTEPASEPPPPPNFHRPPRVGFPLAALVWLALGPYFRTQSAHFGWGFFPTMAWLILLLPLAVLFAIAALRIGLRYARGAYGSGAPAWLLLPWLAAALGYAVMAQLEIVQVGM